MESLKPFVPAGAGVRLCRHWPGEGATSTRLPLFPLHCACFSGSFSHISRLNSLHLSYAIPVFEYWSSPTPRRAEHSGLVLQPGFKLQRVLLEAEVFCSLGHTHKWKCRWLSPNHNPPTGLTNTPQCTRACGLPKPAQSCSCWINEAGSCRRAVPV